MSRRSYGHLRGSKYGRLSDRAVVDRAQSGDARAIEYLLYRYRSLVRAKTQSFYLVGGEADDLVQVGMIGLWQSIMDFAPERGISFRSFARICIERHIITAVKMATRHKQALLNNAVSLDCCPEDCDADFNLSDVLISSRDIDPECLLLRKEDTCSVLQILRSSLSAFEWNVLRHYSRGLSYREIAAELECNAKSVDNALGRIKRKAAGLPYSRLVGNSAPSAAVS